MSYFSSGSSGAAARRRASGGGGGPSLISGTSAGTSTASLLSGSEELVITASRTSGVAPFAVTFDALQSSTGFSDLDAAFYSWDWAWDFDDAGAGTWAISGQSKETSQDPIGAHVFESSGTYTVALTLTDPDTMSVYNDTIEITVTDPDTVYSGTNTRCYSASGDFTGAPAGATQITESNFRNVLLDMAAGRRLLLRRGDTFSFSGGVVQVDVTGPGTIGAFGSGAKPVVNVATDSGIFTTDNSTRDLVDWRVMDIEFNNQAASSGVAAFAFIAGGGCQDVLFLRCDVDNWRISFQSQTVQTKRPEGLQIVDCTITNPQFVSIFASGYRMMVLGTDVGSPEDEHGIRSHYYRYGVFSHSYYRGSQDLVRHAMKMCALATNASNPNGTNGETEVTNWSGYQSAEYWCITDNNIDSDGCQIPMAIAPQSAAYDERIRFGTFKRNNLTNVGPANVSQNTWICASYVSCEDNIFDFRTDISTGVRIHQRGIEPEPTGNRVIDNQFRWPSLPPGSTSISDSGIDTVISGNTDTL